MGGFFSKPSDEEWSSYQMKLKYIVNNEIKKGDFKLKKPLLPKEVKKKRKKKLKIKKNRYFL